MFRVKKLRGSCIVLAHDFIFSYLKYLITIEAVFREKHWNEYVKYNRKIGNVSGKRIKDAKYNSLINFKILTFNKSGHVKTKYSSDAFRNFTTFF